jgi:hypothetical protein
MLARRASLIELEGFDESLYPNEENALMDELQERGGKLIYDPDVAVHRRPRPTLRAFCKMLLNYGRGRGEQVRLHPTLGSVINFVPPLFVLYLLLMPLWAWVGLLNIGCETRYYVLDGGGGSISNCRYGLGWFPLAFYLLALLVQTAWNFSSAGIKSLCALPLLFLTHVFYGIGVWRGLFVQIDKTKAVKTEVTLDRIPL